MSVRPFSSLASSATLNPAVRRLFRNRGAAVGAAIVGAFLLAALLAPWLAPYDYSQQSILQRLLPPSEKHWFGTDEFGRDVFSRVLYGARISVQIGVISVGIAMIFGVALGLVAGFYAKLDNLIMRGMDVLLAFPGILLAMAVVAALGPGLYNVMIAMGIWSIPVYARVARGSVLALREREFIEAARALGGRDARILLRHILPNILPPIVVLSTMRIAAAILSAAGLSFLGLGAQPPLPDWGAMLSDARNYLRDAYWVALFPGMAITLTVLGFNLFGDGLRDALDPRMKH